MKLYSVWFSIILIFYIAIASVLHTTHPPVWPDEAIYAEVAQNIIETGSIKSELWGDAILNVQKKAMWNPPLFFYTYAAWQKLTGISIEYQRLLVQIFGGLTLVLLAIFTKKKGHWTFWTYVPIILWITNISIMKASRFARPEMFVLFYGVASLYFLSLGFSSTKYRKELLVISGVISAVAVLHHIIGILFIGSALCAIIFHQKKKALFSKEIYTVLLPFIIVLSPWLIDIILNRATFIQQFMLSSYPRSLVDNWVRVQLSPGRPVEQLITLSYLILTGIIFFHMAHTSIKKRGVSFEMSLMTFSLFFSWVFAIKGKSDFYSLYPYTLILLSIPQLSKIKNSAYRKGIIVFIILITIAQSVQTVRLLQRSRSYSYQAYAQEVAKNIPEGSVVFISSIPDPYYAVVKKTNRIYEFPAVPIAKEKYLELLNKSEYVVYNGHFEGHLFGSFLDAYLGKNIETPIKIEAGGYSGHVFKLKKERISL